MPALAARRAPAARRGRLAAAAAARPGPASAASSAEPAKPERAGGPLQWLSGAVQALLKIPHDEVEFPIVPLDNDVENWGKAHERKRFNHLDAVEKWTEDGSGDGMAPKKPTDAGM